MWHYEKDIKKYKEEWEQQRFQSDFDLLSGDEDDNSSNKNKKKRNLPSHRSSSVDSPVPKKKRKKDGKKKKEISDVDGEEFDEKEVCVEVLFIIMIAPEGNQSIMHHQQHVN